MANRPVSAFPALQIPLLTPGSQATCWTWQQKFIEWEQKVNTVATATKLGVVKVDNATIKVLPDGTIYAVSASGGTLVPQEQVGGAGTAWTLANAPLDDTEVQIFVRIPGFGGALIFRGVSLDYTISGTAITTAISYAAGTLFARYRM